MERSLVACYAAEAGGHFRPHRDHTTPGTAHRRFAVSLNLNADFDGGEISFPEYGPRRFKPPIGGAVVFACSLLHTVSTMTRGRRYAFLPFLYDDEAATIREANKTFVSEDVEASEPRVTGAYGTCRFSCVPESSLRLSGTCVCPPGATFGILVCRYLAHICRKRMVSP
jgi:hypothetical protein